MTGIVFPNVANALAPLIQMDRQAEETRLGRDRMDRHDQMMMEDRKVAREQHQMEYLGKLSERDRAHAKEQFEVTGKAAAGILSLPDADQPAAYEATHAALTQQGYKINLPSKWSPSLKSQLQAYAIQVPKYIEALGNQPQPMGSLGGGAPAPGGAPGGPTPNRDQFVATMMPHALEVSRQTGLDPRLVLAQSALETGYGTAAPGNNYFGIKSHGQPGGQTLATTEAGPNGALAPTQDSFRTYKDPGASAQDYTEFLRSNPRYAPVLQAQGLDAQIDAMGKSGYATDPNYGAKLRAIAQSLPQSGPQYTMGTAPPSIANAGANAAPMPGPPAGLTPPGPPPAEMPNGPRFAQAGGAPVIPQGGGEPGQGGAMPPPGVVEERKFLHQHVPPGYSMLGVHGKPFYDPQGRLGVIQVGPDGRSPVPGAQPQFIDVPKPEQPPSGYRQAAGGLEYIPGGPADPVRAQAEKVPSGYRVKPDGSGSFEFIPGGPADPAKAKEAPNAGTDAGDVAILQRAFTDPSVVQTPEWRAAYGRQAQPKQAQGGQLMYPNMSTYDRFLNGTPKPDTQARLEETPQSRFQMSGKLADDFNQLKPVKAYREVVPIMQSMQDAAGRNNRVADLNLVYGLAKIMDPESVVREGEQVMVRNAQSLPDWLRGMINTVNGGSAFIPEQRSRILAEAQSRVGSIKEQFDSIANQFSERAKRFGLNPEDVLTVPSNSSEKSGEKGTKGVTYLAPGDRPVNMNEIEQTAKNRGMTTDEVIKHLNLKPADAK